VTLFPIGRQEEGGLIMMEKIRELIAAHAGLPDGAGQIDDDTDLYRAGMKSFASVQLMLALEDAFDIEFPEEMLNRATFRSASAIAQAVGTLAPDSMAA
jgi:acyl carrier protein